MIGGDSSNGIGLFLAEAVFGGGTISASHKGGGHFGVVGTLE